MSAKKLFAAVVPLLLLFSSAWAADPPEFALTWGSPGSGDGQFSVPNALAVDHDGNVYVADQGNQRIQKFSTNGVFLTKWGSPGVGDGQFMNMAGLALDAQGNVYVTDGQSSSYGRVQKFTGDGAFLTRWGSNGNGDGQFNNIAGVAVDPNGIVYVADLGAGLSRVEKFTSDGSFIAAWWVGYPAWGIAADGIGHVYLTIQGISNRIQKFWDDGRFITSWGSTGYGDGQFNGPEGVAVDEFGNVYVADSGNNRIQKFTPDGVFLAKWGSAGSGNGKFNYPSGVAADVSGSVFVTEYFNGRIQKFSHLNCIGIYSDPAGSGTCLEVPQGVQTTLYLVGITGPATANGFTGAEFRIEVTNPVGYLLRPTLFDLPNAGLFDLV